MIARRDTVLLLTALSSAAACGANLDYPISPVPFNQVRIDDVFWKPRLEANRTVTVPACFRKCEETRIPNFRRAAGLEEGPFRGDPFDDSDVYKVAEGAAYCLATHKDPELDRYLENLVALFGKAQEPDGYLYTSRTIHGEKAPGRASPRRFENEMGGVNGHDSHELYNAGHMIEAAVAHWQATGRRTFLDIAIRYADLIARTWGPGPGQLKISPGHQEIELALVKLGRATGERKYIDLARFLLDCRGHYRRPASAKVFAGDDYYSNEVPLTELTQAVGHAVRTGYMLSGMTDIAAILGDKGYERAVDAVWGDTVGTKLYVHGGVGAVGGHEGFGVPYELPNDGYNETCAAIAMCLWNHRMFLLHGDARYVDVLERTLYNGFLAGVSLSGDRFFYPNPLVSRGGYARSEWFGCACCPVNVSRFLPSMPGLVYAVRGDACYVNLYAAGTAEARIAGSRVTLRQETRYPWEGGVKLTIRPERPGAFTLRLRIPGWVRGQPVPLALYRYADEAVPAVALSVNGEARKVEIDKGYVSITRTWNDGDTVSLDLPMPVRRVASHPNVKDDAGRVAIERGPLLYCFEGVDHGGRVFHLSLPDSAVLTARTQPELLGGVTVITGDGLAAERRLDGSVGCGPALLTAVPYYAWCNRGAGQMQVWMPRTPELAAPLPVPTVATQSRVSASRCNPQDTIEAVNDGVVPAKAGDGSPPRMSWWDHKGTIEWLQYDFARPAKVDGVEVWWFDDRAAKGGCRVPASCTVLVPDGGAWRAVGEAGDLEKPGDKPDLPSPTVIRFAPVTASSLRLQVRLREGFSGGVVEWKVNEAR